jgi:hypothetical protein
MGLDAQVIAVGDFSDTVLPALEYKSDFYADVPLGATVVTNVFVAVGSSSSHSLAAAFSVGALDLGKHALNADIANLSALADLFGEPNVAQFQLLRSHGFKFYYLPNA